MRILNKWRPELLKRVQIIGGGTSKLASFISALSLRRLISSGVIGFRINPPSDMSSKTPAKMPRSIRIPHQAFKEQSGATNEKALREGGLTLPLFARKGHIRFSAIHLAQKGQVGLGVNPTLNACN